MVGEPLVPGGGREREGQPVVRLPFHARVPEPPVLVAGGLEDLQDYIVPSMGQRVYEAVSTMRCQSIRPWGHVLPPVEGL